MKVLATTALALGLSASPSVLYAQTSPGGSGSAACQPGDPSCQPGGGGSSTSERPASNAPSPDRTQGEGPTGGATGNRVQGQSGQGQSGTGSGTPTQTQDATRPAGSAGSEGGQPTGQSGAGTSTQTPGARDTKASGDQQQPGAQSGTSTERQGQDTQADQQRDGGAAVNITTEQRTEIKQIITTQKVEPVKIDVNVSVGVVVPRTVTVHRLPPRIVELVPAYRDYVYFVLVDGRIVIVEPDTYKVVVILS